MRAENRCLCDFSVVMLGSEVRPRLSLMQVQFKFSSPDFALVPSWLEMAALWFTSRAFCALNYRRVEHYQHCGVDRHGNRWATSLSVPLPFLPSSPQHSSPTGRTSGPQPGLPSAALLPSLHPLHSSFRGGGGIHSDTRIQVIRHRLPIWAGALSRD